MIRRLSTLSGERFQVRELGDDDLPALLAIWGDPEVMRFMGRPPLAELADAALFLSDVRRGVRQGTLFEWGVAPLAGGPAIGTVALTGLDWQHRRGEIGFALAREHWGRGVMSEAVPLLLDHAFGELRLHRVEADVDPRNAASLRLLERLGFVREGLLRERYLVADEAQDAVFLGLLAREWAALEAAGPASRPGSAPRDTSANS